MDISWDIKTPISNFVQHLKIQFKCTPFAQQLLETGALVSILLEAAACGGTCGHPDQVVKGWREV
jgi:hypothetical protein